MNAVALTAMSFILEKKEGLFERSYAAGKEIIDHEFHGINFNSDRCFCD